MAPNVAHVFRRLGSREILAGLLVAVNLLICGVLLSRPRAAAPILPIQSATQQPVSDVSFKELPAGERPGASPDDAQTRAAIECYRRRDYANAVEALRACLRRAPGDARIRDMLAVSLTRVGDRDQAEVEAREGVRLAPDALTPLNTLAFVLFAKRDYSGAEAVYRQILALYSKEYTALKNLTNVLELQGDRAGAERVITRMAYLYPEETYGYYVLGKFNIECDDAGSAEEYYRFIRERGVSSAGPELDYRLGSLLLAQGRYQEAVDTLQPALKLASGRKEDTSGYLAAKIRYTLAVALQKKGDIPGARTQLTAMLSTPLAYEARQALARSPFR
ncbi:MAG: tetratricopeptide repeat protein [Acidobacteria bacterium]|nr:tetratricopeptide repeat protein [Acidobacteriota bacterium]